MSLSKKLGNFFWLRRRQSEKGAEPKKVLEEAAKKEFASGFRVRAFNDAYK